MGEFFEIVDYTLSTDFEVFIGKITEELETLELYQQNKTTQHFTYFNGNHEILDFFNLAHCILIHSEIDRAKITSSAFQIANIRGLRVPVFCDIGLGWYSGYLALTNRMLNYQIRSAFSCRLTTELEWYQVFCEKYHPQAVKFSTTKRLRVNVPEGTQLPMHSPHPLTPFSPFVPHGPLHDIVLSVMLEPKYVDILVHRKEDFVDR